MQDNSPNEPRTGLSIGSIQLLEELGEGGMGQVFVGYDKKLDRQVAVKLIRPERRLDSVARARFLREARLLSQLEHPNICRLYDLVEEGGLECLVLELVRGESLRARMRAGLTRAEKAKVADQVIAGLVAAHGLSIVHRDLKPENIMLTADGAIKILDFGLARTVKIDPLEPPSNGVRRPESSPSDESASSGITEFGDVMGTPRYMSPEQARGEAVTAASDVYSFGLILSELFTGRSPYQEGISLTSLQHHSAWGDTDPVRGLDGSLAALVGEMTAFLPRDRPSTVVVADRLRSIWDRPRRILRRGLVAAVAASLMLAAAVSTIGLVRAKKAQARAESSEREALDAQAEAEAVNSFLQEMLASPDPREMGRDVRVLEVLERAVETAERSFREQPLVLAEALHTLGNTYIGLGEPAKAEALFSREMEVVTGAFGADHPKSLAGREGLAFARMEQGHVVEAEEMLQELLARSRELYGDDDPDTISVVQKLTVALSRLNRLDEAEDLATESLSWRRRQLGDDHKRTLHSRLQLANILARRGDYEGAERAFREILADSRRVLGDEHPDTLGVLSNVVTVLVRRLHRYSEAEPLVDDLIDARRHVLGDRHPDTLLAIEHRAVLLRRLGRFEESEEIWRNLLATRREVLGENHPDTLGTRGGLALVLSKRGRDEEAEELLRRVVREGPAIFGADHANHHANVGNLANLLMRQERFAEAEPLFQEIFDGQRKRMGDLHPRTLSARAGHANCLSGQGRLEAAEDELRQVVFLDRVVLGSDHPSTLNALANLGLVLAKRGADTEAEACLCEAFEATVKRSGLDHPMAIQLQADLMRVVTATPAEPF